MGRGFSPLSKDYVNPDGAVAHLQQSASDAPRGDSGLIERLAIYGITSMINGRPREAQRACARCRPLTRLSGPTVNLRILAQTRRRNNRSHAWKSARQGGGSFLARNASCAQTEKNELPPEEGLISLNQ